MVDYTGLEDDDQFCDNTYICDCGTEVLNWLGLHYAKHATRRYTPFCAFCSPECLRIFLDSEEGQEYVAQDPNEWERRVALQAVTPPHHPNFTPPPDRQHRGIGEATTAKPQPPRLGEST